MTLNSITEFSDIIKRMGDEREERQLKFLAELEERLEPFSMALEVLSPRELLESYVEWLGGRSDPRETVLRSQYANAIRIELLKRMGG